jgi:TolB-like protein/Flp pilus assembly protein TadD
MLQVMDVLAEPLSLSAPFQLGVVIVVGAGFFVALVLAWYHGEKGRQRVGGFELLVIAAVLAVTGFGLSRLPDTRVDDDAQLAAASLTPLVPLRAVLFDNPSVAVLPFENLGSEDDVFFADGFYDAVLTNLGKIGGVTVLSAAAVRGYADGVPTLREIGKELGADAIGLGNLRRSGQAVRITLQLVEPSTGKQLWADSYDLDVTPANMFAVQDSLSRAIAQALDAALTPTESERLRDRYVPSQEAYDLVQLGIRERAELGGAAGRDAYESRLRAAVEADSTYAEGWALLGAHLAQRIQDDGWPRAWADTATAMANRALQIDPDEPVAYRALGFAAVLGRHQRRRGAVALRKQLELSPGDAGVNQNLGAIHGVLGEWSTAVEYYRRAIRLNPNRLFTRSLLAEALTVLGLYDRAEATIDEVLLRIPDAPNTTHFLAYLRAYQGRYAEALDIAMRVPRIEDEPFKRRFIALLAGRNGDWQLARDQAEAAYRQSPTAMNLASNVHSAETTRGYALLRSGETQNAERHFTAAVEQVQQLLDGGADSPRLAWEIASIESARANRAEALEWARRAYEGGFVSVGEAEMDPMLDPLRGHPEFERIMTEMRADVDRMREEVLAMEAELEAAREAAGR